MGRQRTILSNCQVKIIGCNDCSNTRFWLDCYIVNYYVGSGHVVKLLSEWV